jgi:hypothetical protein
MILYINHEYLVFEIPNYPLVVVYGFEDGSIRLAPAKWIFFKTTTEIGWTKVTINRPQQHIVNDMDELTNILKTWSEQAHDNAQNS